MRNTNEKSLAELLHQFSANRKISEGLLNARIREAWVSEVDKPIRSRVNDISFKNGVLELKVNSAVLRRELLFRKQEIIELLNRKLGEELICEINLF